MRSVLEALYFGRLNVDEIAVTREYSEQLEKIISIAEELRKFLNDEERETLNRLLFETSASEAVTRKEMFVYAFKLGFQFALECHEE